MLKFWITQILESHQFLDPRQKFIVPIVHSSLQKYSISWKFSLNFVYIFTSAWNFLTKFWSSDSSFSRNILTPLFLKFEISTHALIANTRLHTIYKFPDMIWRWNLHWEYSLINKVCQWFLQLGYLTFSKNVFRSLNCTLSFYQIYYVQTTTL